MRGLRGHHLERLATAAHRVTAPDRHRFFDEGGRADRFWLVETGRVGVDAHVPGRGLVVVETLGRDAVLGWSWLFPPFQWRFGARALAPVRAVEFDARLVRTLCADDPELGHELTRRFAEVMLDRLQATRMRLMDVYTHPGRIRPGETLWPDR
ncbi:cyclic nucleotide-binding domain-containing protein [Actinomadura logoneensis]|uniref:Cyclic nucleotide-binding domain-containing protein n=1 Tax=Actinomadura logoneensis TaxID=2293572 RepID=A0A372JJW5_9ACTN|nr:cyclic nucleotide-binding domain-containing protein [Actinomadura logoneensis]